MSWVENIEISTKVSPTPNSRFNSCNCFTRLDRVKHSNVVTTTLSFQCYRSPSNERVTSYLSASYLYVPARKVSRRTSIGLFVSCSIFCPGASRSDWGYPVISTEIVKQPVVRTWAGPSKVGIHNRTNCRGRPGGGVGWRKAPLEKIGHASGKTQAGPSDLSLKCWMGSKELSSCERLEWWKPLVVVHQSPRASLRGQMQVNSPARVTISRSGCTNVRLMPLAPVRVP